MSQQIVMYSVGCINNKFSVNLKSKFPSHTNFQIKRIRDQLKGFLYEKQKCYEIYFT